ncbi:hypothetical protein TWF694_004454 [Orbilia ellipsospora]|uniref:Uncharacterized protein n=1 Tax=Orbilia ellipsospora TaxID=2528407 RepID=A0AAV9WV55_9PEZI
MAMSYMSYTPDHMAGVGLEGGLPETYLAYPSKAQFEGSNPTLDSTEEELNKPSNGDQSLLYRIEYTTALIFLVTTLLSLACIAWFAFLWWETAENKFWHTIVINGWADRAITFSTTAFRISLSIQSSICLCMLASLAIEKSYVPLPDLAAISLMRSSAPSQTDTLRKFVWPIVTSRPGIRDPGTLSVISLTILIALTSGIFQVASTILLSDVSQQPIPSELVYSRVSVDYTWKNDTIFGLRQESNGTAAVKYDNLPAFDYSPSSDNSRWKTTIPVTLPSFAEYAINESAIQREDIVDTGTSLRAFLPFDDSRFRTTLQSYTGKAVVWDSRVICQKPEISDVELIRDDELAGAAFLVTGSIKASVALDIVQSSQPQRVQFFCAIVRRNPGPPGTPQAGDSGKHTDIINRPIICQLPNARIGTSVPVLRRDPKNPTLIYPGYDYAPAINGGGLKSDLNVPGRISNNGGAYLVLNRTYDSPEAAAYLDENPEWGEIIKIPISDDLFPKDTDPKDTLLGTLCYTPLEVADREVEVVRNAAVSNDLEPVFARYANGSYKYGSTLPKLVPGVNGTSTKLDFRGLFTLKQPKGGWAANLDAADGPFDPQSNVTDPRQLHVILDALNLKYQPPVQVNLRDEGDDENGDGEGNGQGAYSIYGNYSLVLDDRFSSEQRDYQTETYAATGTSWLGDLYVAVKEEGNSALALQAVLTVIASGTYYDNLHLMDRIVEAGTVSYKNVSSPGGPFGTRRGGELAELQEGWFSGFIQGRFPVGFAIISATLGLHFIIVFVVFVRFQRETSLSRIGDPWQAVTQISEEDEDLGYIFEVCRMAKSGRDSVRELLERRKAEKVLVGLQRDRDGVSSSLRRRAPGLSRKPVPSVSRKPVPGLSRKPVPGSIQSEAV